MLEADNASELAYCLEQVHLLVTDVPSVAVLRSQLAYMREHYEEGIEYARQLEQSHPAQAQALIAQGCMMLGHLDQAENHFMHAMREMRDINDTYTLARVGTNLAVCLMQYDEWERAYALLKQSRRQQTENQDKVGLLTTEHNLRIAQENLSYLW